MMKKLNLFLSIMLTLTIIFSITIMPQAAKKKPTYGNPPIASNMSISGSTIAGQTLTGNYTYSDPNGDIQGSSKFRWLSSTSLTGTYTAIIGAIYKTYTLTNTDVGKFIKFEVTPVSATGAPNTGTAVQSPPVGPITAPPSSSKVVLGFAVKYYSTDVSSYNSMANHASSIDQIATVTYGADSLGNLLGTPPQDQISYANNNGIMPLALVNNSDANGFNPQTAQSIIENAANKQNFINNLINAIKNNGYKGANIDFEGVPAADRSYYSQFIADVKNALQPLGYTLSVSVPAKAYDSLTNSWNGAYDYKAIGTYADEVFIMSYDEHGSWGTVGPVASIGWVTDIVNYAKTVIPADKILLGLAAYGYDWASTGNSAVSINKVYSLLNTYGGSIQWDAVSQSPYYNYTVNGVAHTIWFENEYSITYKLNLVNENNLLGIGIWRLGLENQAYWDKINAKF